VKIPLNFPFSKGGGVIFIAEDETMKRSMNVYKIIHPYQGCLYLHQLDLAVVKHSTAADRIA